MALSINQHLLKGCHRALSSCKVFRCEPSKQLCTKGFHSTTSVKLDSDTSDTGGGGFGPPFGLEFGDDYLSTNYGSLSDLVTISSSPPKNTRVVVCGGGMVGSALLYHLAKLGWANDVVLIDKDNLGSETSWRGSGFLGGVKLSKVEMQTQRSTQDLVQELTRQGHDTGWQQTGSLHLARCRPRLTHFRKMSAIAQARGTECHMLSPREVEDLCPILSTDDLVGAMWVPDDGVCHPYRLTRTLMQIANKMGAQVVEHCEVNKVVVKENKVVGVETNKGIIECEIFINAAGTWARHIGLLSEPIVRVPIHPAHHYCLETFPLETIDLAMPAIRDPDGNIYLREYCGGLMAGTFDRVSVPAHVPGVTDTQSSDDRVSGPDWDHFQPALSQILHRVPCMSKAVLRKLDSSPCGYSPDGKWITGMSAEVENYYVAAGLKNGGSNAALGLAEVLAVWVTEGAPPVDTYELEVSRFLPAHNNYKFLSDRVTEVPGTHYSIQYPFPDFQSARCLRMSPIFPRMKQQGAVFGQVMGYERPSYFKDVDTSDESHEAPFTPTLNNSFSMPPWFDYTEREYKACRETCGLLDYSSFTKFDIYSQDESVVPWLQYLCSNDVNIPVGGIIHTGLQNAWGGYENDCSLARTAPNHYMMIAPTIQQTRCNAWLRRHLPKDGSIISNDVTSMFTAICIMGPKSKAVLSAVTDFDLSTKSFPFFSYRDIDVGFANGIRAMNLTHTGELGWVLYIPNEFALHVYESLRQAGVPHGLRPAGYYAMRSLRVERFYAFWGQDLDSNTTPLECGRTFRVKLDKPIDFIGREALLRQQEEGARRLYVQLLLDDHDHRVDAWPWGGEPIYRDGQFVGVTTTTGYGYSLKNLVCLGFIRNYNSRGEMIAVTPEYVLDGVYEVDIAGIRYPASVSLRSPTLPATEAASADERYLATQF
ncbi:Glycine cleavage T-protein-like N-terminal [Trinorchestia longiramus]|nr:Glycine cleavage T-protein-like N-terminal [Trinorchestia longiramus]